MRAAGLTPKLRTFNPALQCYCDAGDFKRVCIPVRELALLHSVARVAYRACIRRKQAVALELEIRKAGIAMSELEYTMMLEAMSRCVGRTAAIFMCGATHRALRAAFPRRAMRRGRCCAA